ncbi:MAG: hypothetical protein HZC17_00010 [Candidatus Omnitrophica bacterium]|nr:hypothetical protein [Candidatus Omnitrophota bacterium]
MIKTILIVFTQIVFTLLLYLLGIVMLGLAMYPGVLFCLFIWQKSAGFEIAYRLLALCFGSVAGYFIFGFVLMAIVGLIRFIFRLNLKEGEYPMFSLASAKWALANSLQLIVSIVFMDFILLTPFANLFFRLLGTKMGKHVQINSKFCADLSLLEIGDYSVIGGHSTVICHSFERGKFILRKVRIGKHVVIGLNSVILPGAEIGDGSVIAAGAVLLKNTKVEPRSIFSGVPAQQARKEDLRSHS